MERALGIFAAINLLIIGLSHIFNPGDWVRFFTWLRQKGHVGVFINGFISLGFGALILSFHQIWTGLQSALTFLGCACILKAGLCFLFPATQLRSLNRISKERAWHFIIPGIVFVLFGGTLGYSIWVN